MLNCNEINQENVIDKSNNEISECQEPEKKEKPFFEKKNLDQLSKIQENRREQMEQIEKQKEKMKKNRMKLAEFVLKQGKERAEHEKLDIECWLDKVERVKEERLIRDKENIVKSEVTDEQKQKLKSQQEEYLEKLTVSKKQKEEHIIKEKEKEMRRKEKLARKVLGGEVNARLELHTQPTEMEQNSAKILKCNSKPIERQFGKREEVSSRLKSSSMSIDRHKASPRVGSARGGEVIGGEGVPVELQKTEAQRQTFEREKKQRSNSSACIVKNRNLGDSFNVKQEVKNLLLMDEIKEVDPEERRRRKEQREKFEQKQIEHLRQLQVKKEEALQKLQEAERKKERQKEKLLKEVVGEVKKRTLEELCQAPEPKKQEEPENKGPKRQVDWDQLNSLSQVNEATVCISDWDHFRRRYKLDDSTKVFICENSYKDSKKALLKRGWFENPDPESLFFDIKMTIKIQSIDWANLERNQLCNHFQKGPSLLTTKKNLTQYIDCLQYYEESVNTDSFFPKCFYLGSAEEFNNFLQAFKFNQCMCVLRRFIDNSDQYWANHWREIIVSWQALARKQDVPQELNLDNDLSTMGDLMTDYEWDIVMNHDTAQENKKANNDLYYQLIARYYKSLSFKCGDNSQYRMKDQGLIKDLKLVNDSNSEPHYSLDKNFWNVTKVLKEVRVLVKKIRGDVSQQNSINGDGNIWIMKPSDLSRGRGIQVHNDANRIFNMINEEKDVQVAQKQIERPLIIHKRKFDIRQWVLVTDFNPLTIYTQDECQVRFALNEQDKDTDNVYAHLTNNSVVKYSDEYQKFKENSEIDFQGLMWSQGQLSDFVKAQSGSDVFQTKTLPEIERIATQTFMSVQDEMDAAQTSKNSFELFGFDFMLDDSFNPWLIEVNLSPDMSQSTAITERLVKSMGEDIIKVVVDNKGKRGKDLDFGKFKQIYKGKFQERPSNLLINNLQIECNKIKNVRKI